ncbi:thiol:disulfide interchange protein DsbE [Actinobacillus equuli]|nr:thiol:disulfide interchange protein DsbE [Actinobacillus equuli]
MRNSYLIKCRKNRQTSFINRLGNVVSNLLCRTRILNPTGKQGVEIVGVDYKDERSKAMKFLANYGNPYKANIYDPKGSLGLDLGVYGAPEPLLLTVKVLSTTATPVM